MQDLEKPFQNKECDKNSGFWNERHISTEQYKYLPWTYVLKTFKWIFSQIYTFLLKQSWIKDNILWGLLPSIKYIQKSYHESITIYTTHNGWLLMVFFTGDTVSESMIWGTGWYTVPLWSITSTEQYTLGTGVWEC